MSIQTLITAIDQVDHSLVDHMNIQTDALVGNQCGVSSDERFEREGHEVVYLNRAERGVGRNRNLLINTASASIWVFADDDLRFVDGYPAIVERAFVECPDADVLLFNLIEKNPRRWVNTKVARIGLQNYARYGAARMAVRGDSIRRAGIRFSLEFGGGARYGCGEDTIFLHECLSAGLKLYAVPYALAEIDQAAPSTWFTGYDEKFFSDKGALYARLHPNLWWAYTIRYVVRYANKYSDYMSRTSALKAMLNGGRKYLVDHGARGAAHEV